MSAETDVYDALRLAAGVIALVGTRIYPDARPQDDPLPAIVYYREATEPVNTIHGTKLGERVTMTVQCMAATRLEAEQVIEAAATALTVRPMLERTSDYVPEVETFVSTLKVLHNS